MEGLRKVTLSFALLLVCFRVKPKIGISLHVCENQPRLIKHFGLGLTCAGLRFVLQPERTDIKRTLLARQPSASSRSG